MAKRYKNTKLKQERYGTTRSYKTTYYNKVPFNNTDMYFIAQEGDRCDNLAFRFYGDVTLWWFIARVNNLTTMNIPAGTKLRIPASKEQAEGF